MISTGTSKGMHLNERSNGGSKSLLRVDTKGANRNGNGCTAQTTHVKQQVRSAKASHPLKYQPNA